MKFISTLLVAIVLSFSINAMALTDDENIEFVEAITTGNLKIVKKYVEADAKNVDVKSFAWSPVQMAANKNQIETVKYLLSKGADINYVHPLSHNSAFHLAAFNGFDDMVKLLASKGANVNEKLKADVSILRPLRDGGNTHMVELLTSLGVTDEGCQEEKCF
ncbi:MAG: ankyrin repeat domain-containing protein [Methylotenera sp.]|nr:ankyrin repeat domain-containing protein [Methylotenera sp.]MDO9233164.1 ankyrin repeat domain-containing protein [Methylotenera sp.]MDO9388277.1 ankyrin repeat domain-containing protein [Methylotenera sp.]MDP2101079.1 ankyrin repeat domain-containing protein [Methylotenera sp.]MDP2281728.1 ankyrin repeat domain-containing protein [Methylotenera sp.]